MAITHHLSTSQWYQDQTSPWTLDYPPLFAWFERILSLPASIIDSNMLVVSEAPFNSQTTRVYQRVTVILTDLLLFRGAFRFQRAHSGSATSDSWLAILVTCASAGLIMVDHIHFQYNGMLIGILLQSLADVKEGLDLSAAVGFSVLLNMKHLFLFAAPLYFFFLLKEHVLGGVRANSATFPRAIARLCRLAAVVLLIFGTSFGPFIAHEQIPNVLARLFPFNRGLTHAYWAPNTWSIYTAVEKVLAAWLKRQNTTGSRGLVGDTDFVVLPQISPMYTAGLVLLLQSPVLLQTWVAPKREAFAAALCCCGFAAFLCGWHVHEKAILPPLVVLSALDPKDSSLSKLHGRLLILFSSVAHYSLLPLLFQPAEYLLARSMCLSYFFLLVHWAQRKNGGKTHLRKFESIYLCGFIGIELFVVVLHPLFLAPKLAFLPLLIISIYSAIGVHYSTILAYKFWWCLQNGVSYLKVD